MSYGDPVKHITALYVEESCLHLPYTGKIIERSGLPVRVVQEDEVPEVTGIYPANLQRGKKELLLCRNKGRFFKSCPGTREYNCCEYQVLNIGMNCPMDCVYCILQAYLNNPWLSFFVNIEDMFAELDKALLAEPHRMFRIGTGEFTDSLAMDSMTGLSRYLIEYMSRKDNAVLELKTKSASIGNLFDIDHRNRTIVSWSMNAPAIISREEIRTASLEERIAAASKCVDLGYRVGFHFDPIIRHKDWREGYSFTLERIFKTIPADRIVWISFGALRYLPHLKNIAAERFPHSRFFYDEFVPGLDGKSRYFRPHRVEMYKHLTDECRRLADDRTCLYFCMESDVIWQEVFGFTPQDKGGLPAMLDYALES